MLKLQRSNPCLLYRKAVDKRLANKIFKRKVISIRFIMSEQKHQDQVKTPVTEQWRLIASIGCERDISGAIDALPLELMLAGIAPEDGPTVTADSLTENFLFDVTLQSNDWEIATAKAIGHILDCLRLVDVQEPDIRFARIGQAALLASDVDDALLNMFDVTTDASVAQASRLIPDHFDPNDF